MEKNTLKNLLSTINTLLEKNGNKVVTAALIEKILNECDRNTIDNIIHENNYMFASKVFQELK